MSDRLEKQPDNNENKVQPIDFAQVMGDNTNNVQKAAEKTVNPSELAEIGKIAAPNDRELTNFRPDVASCMKGMNDGAASMMRCGEEGKNNLGSNLAYALEQYKGTPGMDKIIQGIAQKNGLDLSKYESKN